MSSLQKDKAAPFAVSTYAYKVVDDHPILADIMIPKKLIHAGPGSEEWKDKRPILLYFHVGGLVAGQRNFLTWLPQWLLDLAVKHGAVVITADYRLLPEATCEDVLDDLHDLWRWLGSDLNSTVQKEHPGLWLDANKVLVTGGSAGGYCALQLGLSYCVPSGDIEPRARAVVALYPYISLRTPHHSRDYEKNIMGFPQFSNSLVDDHIASIASTRARTGKQPIVSNVPMVDPSGEYSDRCRLDISVMQHGRIIELFGPERDSTPGKRRLFAEDRIEDGKILPPTMFVQGIDDTSCPVSGADAFVNHVRKHNTVAGLAQAKDESEVLRYYKVPGEHLFDVDVGLEGETKEWLDNGVPFIEKHWLL